MRPCGFLAVAVTAAACGRVAFDPQVDANNADADVLATHDEDGDGIVDALDVCPHVFDPGQVDSDDDGVGDACDPQPTLPNRIVRFEPFVNPTDWSFDGATLDGESLIADTINGEMSASLALAPTRMMLQLMARIGAASDVNRRQLSLNAHEDDLRFFYCELFENTPIQKFGLVWTTDDFAFFTLAQSTPDVALAYQDLQLELQTGPGAAAACTTTLPTSNGLLTGSVPNNITPMSITIYAQGIEVAIDYFIAIELT